MVKIHLSNKLAYTFIAFGILVFLTVGVNAVQNPGHPFAQVDPPLSGTCSAGKFIKYTGTANVYECGDEVGLGDITGVTAGMGLADGGPSGAVTLNINQVAGSGITVNSDSISLTDTTKGCTGATQAIKSFDLSGTGDPTCIDVGSGGGYWTDATSYIYANNVPVVNGYVVVEDTGNVGIGPLDPAYKLDVAGEARISGGNLYLYSNKNINTAGSYFDFLDTSSQAVGGRFRSLFIGSAYSVPTIDLAVGDSDTGLKQQGDGNLALYTNNVERMRISSLGRVGIGEVSPQATLHVDGTVRFEDFLSCTALETNSAGDLVCGTDDTGGGGVTGSGTGNRIAKFTATGSNIGDSAVYESGGNIGIGTTSPTQKLDVRTTSGTAIYGASTTASAIYGIHGYIAVDRDGGAAVYGEATGSLTDAVKAKASGSGGTGVVAQAVGTNGVGVDSSGIAYDFYAHGPGIDYGSASSIRWKNNITQIDNALYKVLEMRGVYFDWDKEHGGEHDIGMIAEEVGKVLPEVVSYESNGKYAKGIDYSRLTPLLIEAVKELKTENDALKKRVDTLEKKQQISEYIINQY